MMTSLLAGCTVRWHHAPARDYGDADHVILSVPGKNLAQLTPVEARGLAQMLVEAAGRADGTVDA